MQNIFKERDTESHLQSLEQDWKNLVIVLNKRFDAELDVESILFLIGVQELGKGFKKYNKDQKLELMHIAICTLLEPYGYYNYLGRDEDGYPHWESNEQLPALRSGQQLALMKSCILEYFGKDFTVQE